MHQIAAAGAPPQTPLGELTAIQMPMMYVVGNEKNGYEISEFTGRVGGADWLCPRPYTGNNLANFVCNYQKFSIIE